MKLEESPCYAALKEACWHPDVPRQQRKRLEKFLKALGLGSSIDVTYQRPTNARFKPTHNGEDVMSATQMPKRVRAAVYGHTDIDVDIRNCHPCIAAALCKLLGVDPASVETIMSYAADRDAELANQSLGKDDAKMLVCACLNGCNIYKLDKSDSDGIKNFVAQNPGWEACNWWTGLHQECLVLKRALGKSQEVQAVVKRMGSVKASNMVAMVMQFVETEHMLGAKAELEKRGINWTVYAYDGFQTSNRNRATVIKWIADGCPVAQTAHQLYPEHSWSGNLRFVVKPWAKALEPHPLRFDHDHFTTLRKSGDLDACCDYFESHFFATDNGVLWQQTGRDLYTGHKDNGSKNPRLAVTVPVTKTDPKSGNTSVVNVNFLKHWRSRDSFRAYNNVCYAAPGGKPNPALRDCYNLWSGWAVESVKPDGRDHSVDIACLKAHLRYLMEDSDEGLEYIIKWLAWMFQKPGSPTGVLPAFLSEQGGGKSGFFSHFMGSTMGTDKVLVTTDAQMLLGRFHMRSCKHFLGLDEAVGKDTVMNASVWKGLITEEHTIQEKKGVDPVQLDAVGNYAMFSNSTGNSVCVEKGDRRYVVCQLGATKQKPYYDKLFSLVDGSNPDYNPQVLRAFYDELMAEDLSAFKPQRDRYISDTYRRFQEANLSAIERWLTHRRAEPSTRMLEWSLDFDQQIVSQELWKDFRDYSCEYINLPKDKVLPPHSFKIQLGNLVGRGSGVRGLKSHRTNSSRGYKISKDFFDSNEHFEDAQSD